MTGGLIQLVAYGFEDMYLTSKPQITFFKVMYRRHTNFSTEPIPKYFNNQVKFGRKVTCSISKDGDLMGNMYVVFKLPEIKRAGEDDLITQFAWVRQLGYAMIKYIEIEINGHVIDRHYGDWMSIWAELTGLSNGEHARGHNIMIGNTPETYGFSSSKNELLLYVPISFWFCRGSGLTLPLICLQCSDVKINIEINDVDKCYIIAPSHYIQCRENLSGFIQYEYIEQNINGDIRAGTFIKFDPITKRLYYLKLTSDPMIGYPVDSYPSTDEEILEKELEPNYESYKIVGQTSHYIMHPDFDATSKKYFYTKIKDLAIKDCFLLIDFYFLDNEERVRMAQSKHDYLIEQMFYTSETDIDGINNNPRITVDQPCKLLTWITQMKYNKDAKDYFNYSDSYQRKFNNSEYPDLVVGQVVGNNIVLNETITLNGSERISTRNSDYFNSIQAIQFLKVSPQVGVNMLSTSIFPLMTQPSGTCNMSQLDDILAQLQVNTKINQNNKALFKAYCLSYNVLRFASGLAGVVFSR